MNEQNNMQPWVSLELPYIVLEGERVGQFVTRLEADKEGLVVGLANGKGYSKEDFPQLYALVGDAYNNSSVSEGKFMVPDLRGRMKEKGELS